MFKGFRLGLENLGGPGTEEEGRNLTHGEDLRTLNVMVKRWRLVNWVVFLLRLTYRGEKKVQSRVSNSATELLHRPGEPVPIARISSKH